MTGPARARGRRAASIALLAVPLVAAAVLWSRSSPVEEAGTRGTRPHDSEARPPDLAVAGAPVERESSVSLTLAFPSRARLDASVLVSLLRGSEEAGSFLVVSSPVGASGQGARAAEGSLEVSRERVDAERAEVTVSVERVPSGLTAVEARTVDLVEPSLRSGAVPFRTDGRGALRIELRVPERSGFLAVRALRGGEPVDDVVAHLRRGPELLRSFRVAARAPTIVRAPPGEPLTVEVSDYPGVGCLGPATPVSVRAEEGRIVDVDLALPPGNRVVLRALDRHGEAAAFSLALWRMEGDRPRHVATAGLLRPDTESRTWRGRLAPATYVAVASPRAHFAPARRRFELTSEVEAEQSVEFALDGDGVRTRLRLTEADGTAVPGALVNLNHEAETVDAVVAHVGKTDDAGALTTPPLPPGTYALHVWDRGLAKDVALGGGGVLEIALPDVECADACGSLEGEVVGPDGRAARWPKVFLRRGDGWSHVSHVGVDGRYAFPRVAAGEYEIEVRTSVFSENRYRPHRGRVSIVASEEAHRDVRLEDP